MAERKISHLSLLALTIGFFFLSGAIMSAYSKPASSYELSIYHQTPAIFWIGITISLVLSVIVTFTSKTVHKRITAISLGSFSIITVVSLPLIRSYYYVGEGDALSHLGTALDINAGAESPLELLYPLSHMLSIVIYQISEMEIRRGLVLILSIVVAIFILFVPLTARLFSDSQWITYTSVFSGLLLLPINHFAGHMHPHPTSYAMFFIPLLMYLFISIIVGRSSRSHVILLVVGMIGMVLIHPQQAANIIILFGTIAGLQLVIGNSLRDRELLSIDHEIKQTYPYLTVMVVILWLWTKGLEIVAGNIQRPILYFFAYRERETAGNVRSAVPSLEAAGGSVEEIFVKLFLIGMVYSALAAVLMAASFTELTKYHSNRLYKYSKRIALPSSQSNLMIIYLSIGFIAIVGVFLVYIIANQSTQYFRHHSFMMVVITILGAVSLGRLLEIADRNISRRTLITGVCVLFVVFLMLSVPVIHISPYLYQESQHVPKSQVDGYETFFTYHDEDLPVGYIRSNSGRYYQAIVGQRNSGNYYDTVEGKVPYTGVGSAPDRFSEEGIRSHYEEQTYLVVTNRDRIRDRELHSGVRYSPEDYQHLDEESSVVRVQDNGGFTLYRINP